MNNQKAKEILLNYLNNDKSLNNKPSFKEKKLQVCEIVLSEAIIVIILYFINYLFNFDYRFHLFFK